MSEKLFIVYGTGNDAVGLVQKVTTPIAEAGGNILDLRQDVMHGLFTLFLVVDLGDSSLRIEELKDLVDAIGEETGLGLSVDKYVPVPRSVGRQNLLMILLGRDQPGVIAKISALLSSYQVNIEFSQMIAREGVFLMELHTDISRAVLPLTNLEAVLQESMAGVNISTMFQAEDVFNKQKRVIVFDLATSFIGAETTGEIRRQAGLEAGERYGRERARESAAASAALLGGLPADVVANISEAVKVTDSTRELLQTLKIMGYKIVLVSRGFTFFTDVLKRKLDIDACYGFRVPVNDDSQTLTGELDPEADPGNLDGIITEIMEREGVAREAVTVLSDEDGPEATPGIRVTFNMKVVLDYYNEHVLSRESLTGILGSFGLPTA